MDIKLAILTVITTQFKQDMKEAFALVEGAGYRISKYDGCWHVKNLDTNKSLEAQRNGRYVTIWSNSARYSFTWDNTLANRGCYADLVGMLNKPVNSAWRAYQQACNSAVDGKLGGTNFRQRREELRYAKNRITYREQDIAKVKAEIEKQVKNLEIQVRFKVEAELELARVRKELGLTK